MSSLRRSLALALTVGAGIALHAAPASAARDFDLRFGANEPGAIAIAANTLLSCPEADPGCGSARAGLATGADSNNNGYEMTHVDVDDDPATFASSRARLVIPADGEVLFAGLYVGADRSAGTGGEPAGASVGTFRLRAPGDASYRTMTAAQLDLVGDRYHGFVDVTSIVRGAGSGDYTVADVQAGTGEDRYAGWSLVVAYRDPTAPARNLSIFDGYQQVSRNRPEVDVRVTGFRTPKVGPVHSAVGVVAYEGDRGATGDGADLDGTPLADALKPEDNVFNSEIEREGQRVASKYPDFANQLGFDAFTARVDGALGNDAASTTLHLTTGAETYFPGVVTFETELYAPYVRLQKTVRDVDGGEVEPGDELEYAIVAANEGGDGAQQVVVRDPMPDRTSYVADSAEITAGDGTAGFEPATSTAIFRVGRDGALAPGEHAVVRFRVRVDRSVPSGTVIANRARADYVSQTLGIQLDALSDAVTAMVRTPNLLVSKPDPAPVGKPEPAPAARDCLAHVLRLVDVRAAGRHAILAGETSKANAGRQVSLLLARRRVGTATVRPDGTFRTRAPLPPREIRSTGRARYHAKLGELRSPALKLVRRMHTTAISYRDGMVTIAGRVTNPLARPVRTVTLREYDDCRGAEYRVVKRHIRVSPGGRFRATVPAPAGGGAAYYRALTNVRATNANAKTFPTFTLLRGVRIANY